MKRFNFSKMIMILALPLMMAGLNSCKPEDGPVDRPEIKIKGETGDFGSTATLIFAAEEETKTVTINSNMDWTVKESSIPSWVTSINPKTDKKGEKAVEIKVSANDGERRSENIEFYVKDYTTSKVTLTVEQIAPGEPTQDDILFFEDFGTTASNNPAVADYTGYTKKSPAGLNQSGVTYESNGGSIRTSMPPASSEFSGAPLLFLNSDVTSKPTLYFTIKDIDINGNTQLTVKFGAGVIDTYPSLMAPNPSEIKLYAGWDGESWAEITYTSAIDSQNDWYWVQSEFAVPNGTQKLFIKLVNTVRQARYDDFQVVKGGNGAVIEPETPPAVTETTIKALNDRINANKASQDAGDYFVKGIVTTDLSKGNYTNSQLSMMTEGATTAWNGITLRGVTLFDGTTPLFAQGEEIKVDLSAATIQGYRGTSAADGDPYVNQVAVTSSAIEKTGRTATLTPITITYDKLNEYQNMLVQIESVQSESAATQTWATGGTLFTINDNASTAFTVFIANGNSLSDIVDQTFLTGNGTIKGLAIVYGGNSSGARSLAQLAPRNYADVSGLTGNRVGTSNFFEVTPSATPVNVSAAANTKTFNVTANVAWTVTSSNPTVFSVSPAGASDSKEVTVTYGDNESTTNTRSAVITFQTADTSIPEAERKVEITIIQSAKVAGGTAGVYSSNVSLPASDNATDKHYKQKANIGGTEYDVLKLGTSSVGGTYTTTAISASGGDLTLSFYGVSWKGKDNCPMTVTVNGGGTIDGATSKVFTLRENSGATGNPTYTLALSDTDNYYQVTIVGATANTTLTFSTANSNPRAILPGINVN